MKSAPSPGRIRRDLEWLAEGPLLTRLVVQAYEAVHDAGHYPRRAGIPRVGSKRTGRSDPTPSAMFSGERARAIAGEAWEHIAAALEAFDRADAVLARIVERRGAYEPTRHRAGRTPSFHDRGRDEPPSSHDARRRSG